MASGRRQSKTEKQPENQSQEVLVPTHWERSPEVLITFVNHIFVRLQDDHVILTFGQSELPYEIEVTEEVRAQLQEDGLPVQVVSRLAVTHQKLGEMAEQMNRIYNVWLQHQGE